MNIHASLGGIFVAVRVIYTSMCAIDIYNIDMWGQKCVDFLRFVVATFTARMALSSCAMYIDVCM